MNYTIARRTKKTSTRTCYKTVLLAGHSKQVKSDKIWAIQHQRELFIYEFMPESAYAKDDLLEILSER